MTPQDPLLTGALPSHAVIRGKVMFGLILVAWAILLMLPFLIVECVLTDQSLLALTTQLTVLALLLWFFIEMAIFTGAQMSSPGSLFAAVLWAAGFFDLFAEEIVEVIVGHFIMGKDSCLAASVSPGTSNTSFWLIIAVVLFALMGYGIRILAVTQLEPRTTNRALPARITATVAWLVTGAAGIALMRSQNNIGYLVIWNVITIMLVMTGFGYALNSIDAPGERRS